MWWNILVSLLLMLPTMVKSQRHDCSQNEYDRCVRIADPLVKEAHLVFPDNLNDLDIVCSTWNRFVDCLKRYTENCFTDQQRRQFNRAVESPIESVHQMCMQSSYQKEYLQYAPCIKNTIIQRIHCGPHYNLLVEQVEQGDIISKSTLCCSHDRFKQCVQRETRRLCDGGLPNGQATRFATQIIDKALRFLQEQCINYIPNSGDCSFPSDSYSERSDPTSVISTASSERFPWSSVQPEMRPKEISPSRIPKLSTTNNWLPSTMSTKTVDEESSGSAFPTQFLGTRTRPASYGRSRSWSTESGASTTSEASSPSFSERYTTPKPNREQFATTSTWDVYGGVKRNDESSNSYSSTNRPSEITTTPYTYKSSQSLWNPSVLSTSETWYPAAGNQLTNEVDEPNQLGLKKPPNGGRNTHSESIILCVVVFINLRTIF